MSIITFNPMPQLVCLNTSIYKYMDFVINGNLDRNILFKKVINMIIKKHNISKLEEYDIYYIDDRIDNITDIKEKYPNIKCFHCDNTQIYIYIKINFYKKVKVIL